MPQGGCLPTGRQGRISRPNAEKNRRHGFSSSIAFVEGDLRLTYREINLRVNKLAGALAQRVVGRGDRVALLMFNCMPMVECYFALAKLGAVAVPKAGEALTHEEIIEWCAGHLAGYKKPRSVGFTDQLPRNAAGKVLKTKLRERYR